MRADRFSTNKSLVSLVYYTKEMLNIHFMHFRTNIPYLVQLNISLLKNFFVAALSLSCGTWDLLCHMQNL